MAWWEIEHTCGHVERVQLYGPHANRERKAARMEAEPCLDCRVEAANGDPRFAPLEGTDKQVAWAADIRGYALHQFEIDARYAPLAADEKRLEELRRLIEQAASRRTDASWWIDHRSEAYRTLRGEAESELGKTGNDGKGEDDV